MSLLTKIFGDYSSKEVKRVMPIQKKVLSYEDEYSRLSDEELKAKTPEFKERLKNGERSTIFSPKHLRYAARLHQEFSI